MEIKEISKQIHEIAVSHGFWEDGEDILTQVTTGDMNTVRSMILAQKLALVHSEVSEALEADRKNRYADLIGKFEEGHESYLDESDEWFKWNIKDTVEDEIADAVIRLFDIAVHLKMDLEWHIAKKVQYNAGREYKHNKSY